MQKRETGGIIPLSAETKAASLPNTVVSSNSVNTNLKFELIKVVQQMLWQLRDSGQVGLPRWSFQCKWSWALRSTPLTQPKA